MDDAFLNKTYAATLTPNVAQQLCGQNFNRRHLLIQNVGNVGSVTIGFGAAPTLGYGITLDPAATSPGQGGSYNFSEQIPYDSVWAISNAAATVVAVEGV